MKKIDIHVHAVKTKGGITAPGAEGFCTPAELIEIYNILGVEKAVILPLCSMEYQWDASTNREVKEIVEENPERFAWFCGIDPRMGINSENTDFSYILEFYKKQGAKGVGEITSNLYFDDPRVLNLFKHCEKCEMPVLFHIGQEGGDYGLIDEMGLPRLEKVLQAFPDLTFIGHSQKFWAEISGDVTAEARGGYPTGKVAPGGRVVELMRKHPNLHADLSAGSGYNAVSRDPDFGYSLIEEFQDRLYYGTDICAPGNMNDSRVKLGVFLDDAAENGKISKSAYEKVCRTNALKILK